MCAFGPKLAKSAIMALKSYLDAEFSTDSKTEKNCKMSYEKNYRQKSEGKRTVFKFYYCGAIVFGLVVLVIVVV